MSKAYLRRSDLYNRLDERLCGLDDLRVYLNITPEIPTEWMSYCMIKRELFPNEDIEECFKKPIYLYVKDKDILKDSTRQLEYLLANIYSGKMEASVMCDHIKTLNKEENSYFFDSAEYVEMYIKALFEDQQITKDEKEAMLCE